MSPRGKPAISSAEPSGPSAVGLDVSAGMLRLVVVERQGAALRVVSWNEIPASDQPEAESVAQGASVLAPCVPGSSLICRLTPAPSGGGDLLPGGSGGGASAEDLAAAMALQAEALLPASLPGHRRGGGVVDLAGEVEPAGVLVGWLESPAPLPLATAPSDLPTRWIPEPIALWALARELTVLGASAEPGAWLARASADSGALVLVGVGAAQGPGRPALVLRATRLARAEPDERARQIVGVLAETLAADPEASAGLDHAARAGEVAASASFAGVIPGMPGDPSWIGRFGVALGCAIAALRSDEPQAVRWRSVSMLTPTAERRRVSALQRAVDALSEPRRALWALAACVGVMLFWPLAVHALRAEVLSSRTGGVREQQERVREAEQVASFAQRLREHRWPMTKLLADVAGAAPVGVTVWSVDLAQGQPLRVTGSAERNELVTVLQENLNATRVFARVQVRTRIADERQPGGAVEFDLTADVAAPLLSARPAEDYIAAPLADRLYGPGASGRPPADASAAREPARESAPRGRDARDDRPARDRGGESSASRGPGPAPAEAPPALTDAEIAQMDRSKTMLEFASRRRLSGDQRFDEATRQRLTDEAERLRQRMESLRGGGS